MTKNIIAIGAFVVLGIVALLVFREEPKDETEKASSKIVSVDKEALDTIKIKRHEGKEDEAKIEKMTLKKIGDDWRMAEPVDYELIDSSVRRMVDTLVDLTAIDTISKDPSSHEKFELDDANGVEVEALGKGEKLAHLVVGKSKNNMTFVRLPGQNEVYRLKGYNRSTFDKSVKSLRNKLIVKRDLKEVSKVTFNVGDEPLILEYLGEGNERKLEPKDVEIENFNEKKATGIIRSLVSFSTTDFVDEALPVEKTGLGDDANTIVVTPVPTDNAKEVTVFIGKDLEEEKKTYVKTSESNQIFLVSTSKTDRFKIKADDFARTDEELAKEQERRQKAAENQLPAMGGVPGNQQIPPDVMRKIQAQMANKQAPQ